MCLNSTARLLHSCNEGDEEEGALTIRRDQNSMRNVDFKGGLRVCLFLGERAGKSYFA